MAIADPLRSRLTPRDRATVRKILSLRPTATQLVAALHHTFDKERTRIQSPPPSLEITTFERVRRIDPERAGVTVMHWGETIEGCRFVHRGLAWYPIPERDDAVGDDAMRQAWPEHTDAWPLLTASARLRHEYGWHASVEEEPSRYDDPPF